MSHKYFVLEEDYHFKSNKVCKQLEQDFERCYDEFSLKLTITTDGTIKIKKDFTWDGCSPKLLKIFDIFWLGTPDGLVDIETGKPITYYASLVHDALGKVAKKEPERVPFNREERDLIFKEMLEGFALQWLYYLAVRIFGGLYSTFF